MRHPLGRLIAAVLIALPGAGSPVLAQAEAPDAYGDDYQHGDTARVRYAENGATIVRSSSNEGYADTRVGANSPVFPADTIRTARDQRVEVELAGGTIVRLDRDTDISFQALPRSDAMYRDNTVLALRSGLIQLDARLGEGEEIQIDTPEASVYLLEEGDFRIETGIGDRTRVIVRRGVAEVVGERGSVLVRGGTRTDVFAGRVPEDARSFNTLTADGFDRWVAAREDAYRVRDRYAGDPGGYPDDLPYEVRPYAAELSSYGRWVSVPTYGWVWYPHDVGAGWRPYYDGYWHYGPGGYFWVSSEPWGWAPYHYGRWGWIGGHGWCWIPGRVFAGAWVSWSWGSLYVGWAPLDYWGRPCYMGSRLVYSYYDPHCWTFVNVTNIVVRDVRRYAVPVERIPVDVSRHAVAVRAPRVAPTRLASSPEWRERAARMVAEDRRARVSPIDTARTSNRARLEDVDARLVERRRARTAGPARDDTARPLAPRPTAERGPRATVDNLRDEAAARARDRAVSGPSRERPDTAARPQNRTGADRSDRRTTGYSRRIFSDPRAAENPVRRSDSGAPERTAPGTSRSTAPPGRSAETLERDSARREGVRDFYDRLSRPRRTEEPARARQVSPRDPGPSRTPDRRAPEVRRTPSADRPARPEARGSSQQPPAAPRVAPRREAPTPRPQAVQPRTAPRQAPQSAQPKAQPQKTNRGDRRGETKKDRR